MKKVVIILLSMFLLMCCAFGLTACEGGGDDSGDNPNTEQPNNPDDGDNDNEPTMPEEPKEELTPSDIYKKVNPSVVFILIDNLQGIASGTGFFIDDEGTIVTNYHVIEDGTAGVIQLSNGTQAAIGNVLGYDEDLDIAVLETTATNTTPVEIGNSSLVEVGDTVYAIGYPAATTIGFSSSTFTTGMVSMNRSIGGYNYIQSTVDITHGNSGGTLINTYGEVIGITTAGLNVGDVDYMNLSIPIQRVDTVALDDNESLLVVTKRHYPVYARFYNGSSLFTTQTLKYEQTATVPSSSPSKTGYTFAGWYADSGLTTPFDFSTKILEDTRIYAKFDINTYTVTYNLNSGKWNGTTPDSTWTENNSGTALPVPVRSGYLFEGWTDSSGNFVDKLPTSSNLGNVTYNARWIEGAEGLTISNGTVTDYSGTATSVKVPDSFRGITVTKIGNSAFSGATNLQSITLSDTITSIGGNAFADCNINEVYAPSSCAGAVAKQTGATTVVVTSGNAIGNSAFSGCTNLKNITLPNELTTIGSSAFNGCTGLENITIPNGVVTIDSFAFSGCVGLKNITLPNELTTIGSSAFNGCNGLTSIVIGRDVTRIGGYAFADCNNVKEIYYNATEVPDFTTSSNVFKNVGNAGGGITVIFGETVAKIPANLFYNCGKLLHVSISDSKASIGNYAFYGCNNLASLTLGNGITSIGNYAFNGCSNLTSVTIPNSVTSIGSSAFSKCTGLKSITLPFAGEKADASSNVSFGTHFGYIFGATNYNNIDDCIPSSLKTVTVTGNTSIGGYAFYGCERLENIIIGNSITSIGEYAFSSCSNLTSITIGEGVTSIGNYAFYSCVNLETVFYNAKNVDYPVPSAKSYIFNNAGNSSGISVVFGDKVESIPQYLFYQCSNLTNITFSNSVRSIGHYTFSGCTGLTDLTIPENMTGFGSYAFSDCTGLTHIYYNARTSSFSQIRSTFENIGNEENGVTVIFGDTVSSISRELFAECPNLSNVVIGNNVTSIGEHAFNGCGKLTSITIPASVTSIGYQAFDNCTNLTNVIFENTEGWQVSFNINWGLWESVSSESLSNPSTAATYFASTYRTYSWRRL